MPDIEIRRDGLRTTRAVAGEPRAEVAAPGEVQLAIASFGLSANNVTYGVFGDGMGYWKFFPASAEAWGRVPVWGFGDVVVSGVDGIEEGERFYGYFPMSSFLTVQASPSGTGFTDAAAHRSELPSVYNEYVRIPHGAPHPDETMLLRPLFATAFALDGFLAEQAADAEAIVLSSASSKTAYSLAYLLAQREDGPLVIGLTSPGNLAFVESLGVYDAVVAYDEIKDAAGDSSLVYVDMSGDAAVREAVHRTAGDRLRRSVVVGATHWEQLAGGTPDLPGPAPALFFAPTELAKLRDELGGAELGRRLESAWAAFVAQVGDWLDVDHAQGAEAVEQVWLTLVDGHTDPRRGYVLRLP